MVDSLTSIEEFTLQLPFIIKPLDLETEIGSIGDFEENPPENLQQLLHVGWSLLNESDSDTYREETKTINSTILKTLERYSTSFDSQA